MNPYMEKTLRLEKCEPLIFTTLGQVNPLGVGLTGSPPGRRWPGQGGLWAEPGWLGPELTAGVGGSAGQDDSSLWPCASRPLNTLAHRSLWGPPKP